MASKRLTLPRSYRLSRSSDLEQVKKAGRRIRTDHLEVRASDSLLSHARIAVVAGKHGHTIVQRNLLKRRLRELFRTRVISSLGGLDIVVRAMASAYGAEFAKLSSEVDYVRRELSGAKPSQ